MHYFYFCVIQQTQICLIIKKIRFIVSSGHQPVQKKCYVMNNKSMFRYSTLLEFLE